MTVAPLPVVVDLDPLMRHAITRPALALLAPVPHGSDGMLRRPLHWLQLHGWATVLWPTGELFAVPRADVGRPVPELAAGPARPLADVYRDALLDVVWLPWFAERGWRAGSPFNTWGDRDVESPSGRHYVLRTASRWCDCLEVALWREGADVRRAYAAGERVAGKVDPPADDGPLLAPRAVKRRAGRDVQPATVAERPQETSRR